MSSPAEVSVSSLPGSPPELGWTVERLTRIDSLHAIVPQWEALAAQALEPNVFYEPWLMLPALEHFHRKTPLEIYTIYVEAPGRPRRLVGLVPFARETSRWRIPTRRYSALRYYYCGLCTPLLDATFGEAAIGELLRVLEQRRGVFQFSHVRADGPAMAALREPLTRLGDASAEVIERAELRPTQSREAYLATLSSQKRSQLRRRERQLRRLGTVNYDILQSGESLDAWIDEFLRLEVSGWKGRAGSAFASTADGASFFREICHGAHKRRRLEMFALRVDGQAIASQCWFSAGNHLYVFRTAFDEQFGNYAPGVLLTHWYTCEVHERKDVTCVDSCADPNSTLYNKPWPDRRSLAAFRLETNAPLLPRRVLGRLGLAGA